MFSENSQFPPWDENSAPVFKKSRKNMKGPNCPPRKHLLSRTSFHPSENCHAHPLLLPLRFGTCRFHVCADDSWVGKKVLPTKDRQQNPIWRLDRWQTGVFSPGGPPGLHGSRRSKGWLRLFHGHREGWVEKADFILALDAPGYFNDRVKHNPNDTWALYMRAIGWLEKASQAMPSRISMSAFA